MVNNSPKYIMRSLLQHLSENILIHLHTGVILQYQILVFNGKFILDFDWNKIREMQQAI